MEAVKQALAPLLSALAKLSPRARSMLLAVGGLGIVVALGLVVLGASPMRPLFSNLDPRDAAAVVAALDSAKIDYELGAGGTSIRVAEDDLDSARLLLAEQDLPKSGGVGFELFAEQSFGVTDFAQQVNYRRALQGELERTISKIDTVDNARVHITLPRKAVFEDEKIAPTASITLELLQGRELGDRSVGAMRHLVASAVEGLEASGVTVVDTKGNLLSRAGAGDDTATAALDYETDLERALERRLTALLERTVGVGGAEVRVASDVDFSRTDTTEEVYDPEQTAVRSESNQESIDGGGGAGRAGGVAGAPANAPGANAGAAAAAGSSSRMVSSKQYEVNRTVIRTVGPEATLKRLTVAVLVDGTYTPAEDGSDPVFTPRSAEELAELQGIVENAMGFDSTRGDSVKISSVPFHDRPVLGDIAGPPPPAWQQWLPYGVGGGVLLLGAAGWFFISRRRKGSATVVQPELLPLPATVQQAQAALQGGPAALAGSEQAALPAAEEVEDPGARRDEVVALANSDPERTADIIRSWILSDEQP